MNLADVDLRLLRVFHAVARNQGLKAAQDDLGVTQATISNQLSQLEERLGMQLCKRGRAGFALSDEGKLVLEASRNLFRSIENFRSALGSVRGELTGDIYFGTVDALWSSDDVCLDEAYRAFSELAPKVVLHTEIASPQDLVQGLGEDRFHLILAPAQRIPQPLRAVMAFEERQSLYCGRDHPLFDAEDSDIAIAELPQHAYVARSYTLDWAGPDGVRLEPHAVTSHMESSALFVLSGKYMGHLPAHFARHWVDRGDMRCVLEDDCSYLDRFYLAYRRREQNRAVRLLFDCLRKQFPRRT
jgi:DNA-binding transcriptional LysR family regulator